MEQGALGRWAQGDVKLMEGVGAISSPLCILVGQLHSIIASQYTVLSPLAWFNQ